jgi:UDP-glucuronate 4-epimerase
MIEKFLITGVSGYIGGALARQMLADGAYVCGVDRDPMPADLRAHERFAGRQQDLTEPIPDDVLDAVSVVFHLAASTGVSSSWGSEFQRYVEDNIVATQVLMSSLNGRKGIRRIVVASSGSVYGDGPRKVVTEEAMPQPHSPYAVTKKSAEDVCMAYSRNFDMPIVCLRLFYVVGPGQRPDVIVHKMIDAALRSGKVEIWGRPDEVGRDFVTVDDVVRAFIAAADPASDALGQYVNIGSGSLTTLREVGDLIAELCGVQFATELQPARPGYINGSPAGIARASKLLDWEPRVSLEDALERQVDWQRGLIEAER